MTDMTKPVLLAEPRRCGIGSRQRVTSEGRHGQQTVNNRERGMRSERRGAKTFVYQFFFGAIGISVGSQASVMLDLGLILERIFSL